MVTKREIQTLFDDGYIILCRPRQVNTVSPQTIEVFSISTPIEELRELDNQQKYLVFLQKGNDKKEYMTDNMEIVHLINELWGFQMETVGFSITAKCLAIHPKESIHLDSIIPMLGGLHNWEFIIDEHDRAILYVKVKTDDAQESKIGEVRRDILLFLDVLSYLLETGFFLTHFAVAKIPRRYLTVSFGQPEHMLSYSGHNIGEEIVSLTERCRNGNSLYNALRGYNQSLIDDHPSSRLERAWASVEHVFGTEPKALLTREELEALIRCAREISTLQQPPERLNSVEKRLRDRNIFALETRNERIAETISDSLGIDKECAVQMIKQSTTVRGKGAHSVICSDSTEQEIDKATEAMRSILLQYINRAYSVS